MVTVKNSDGHYENPEPGSYAATCYKVIDLGTQESEYQGKKIKRRQVIIGWELSEKMSSGEPFTSSAFFTASLSEKSKLRPMLESWRGAAFTPEELNGFDLAKLIGKPCLVSLVLNEKKKVRVGGVSKLPKGMQPSAPTLKPIHFDLEQFDEATFNGLSEKIKEIIRKSPEYALVGTDLKPVSVTSEEEAPSEESHEEAEVPF
jgi:hypothetical protein